MDQLLDKKNKPWLVGLGQALAVIIYVALIAAFMNFMMRTNAEGGFLGTIAFLTLFVFSAAVTGTAVFGLPVYFAINGDIRRSFSILGYTLLSLFLIIVFVFLLMFYVSGIRF